MGQEGGERVRRVQVVVATGLPKDETWDGDVGERILYLIGVSRGRVRGRGRTALARGWPKEWVRDRTALAIG